MDSLDERIRNNNVPQMNMSLDEYIYMKKIKTPQTNSNAKSHHFVSKFDRYKHQDDDDDDDDDGDMDEDDMEGDADATDEMPKLVPFVPNIMPPKKPIHDRLGERGSICESIHTSRLQLAKPTFKAKKRVSVQARIGKNYVNPATIERNRIAIHAINEYCQKSKNNRLYSNDDDNDGGNVLLNAFTQVIERETAPQQTIEQKYNMKLQKEISYLQGKKLFYACPGKFVVSSDGPGVRGPFKVPTHSTDVSLNQRFA